MSTSSKSIQSAVPLLLASLLITTATASAQVTFESDALTVTLGGRVNTQFNSTSVDDEIVTELLIRRARLTADVEISDFIGGRVQPEFGGGDAELKDAYVRLSFDTMLRLTAGQFKRPFDRFFLLSANRLIVVEREGDIRGVSDCPGVGGLCSYGQFTQGLGFADRDIGVMLDGRDDADRFRYSVAVTNGAGDNTAEENDAKSVSARLEFAAAPDLTVGANLGLHDYVDAGSGEDEHAFAFAGDVDWGGSGEGPHVRAGGLVGENWRALGVMGDPSTVVAVQGIGSYRRALEGHRLVDGIEPLIRLSWGDGSDAVDGDDGLLVTPGLVVHFVGLNRFLLNVDVWSPAEGDTEWSVKAQTNLVF